MNRQSTTEHPTAVGRSTSGKAQSRVTSQSATASSVLAEFDETMKWYAIHAWRARQWHYAAGTLLIVTGASVSVVALAFPDQSVTVAVLGAVVVVLTGARAFYQWQDNWYRFTGACQALKQERRKYVVGQPPYDDPATRQLELAKALNRVESKETQGWLQLKDLRSEVAVGTPPSSAEPAKGPVS